VGAGSGGRLALSLLAVFVVMASGAAGTTIFGSGGGHSGDGPAGQDRMLGSALARRPAPAGTASAAATHSAHPAGGSTRHAQPRSQAGGSDAGRFNVGSTHSPELLRQLQGPLADTGDPAGARYGAALRPAPEAAAGIPMGLDVASFQHPTSSQYPDGAPIDWSQVAGAGYTFAAIKVTEGNYYTNPFYASDLAAAKAAGLYVTGYHFAIPNVGTATAQADYAVNNGQFAEDGQTLPLELDVEYDPYTSTDHTNECYGLGPAQMVAWISAFDNEVQHLTGRLPIIYTTADWWDTCTGNSTAFGSSPLWAAAYATSSPPMPAGWPGWSFWQYSSGGTVPGIAAAGATDVSYFNDNPGPQQDTEGNSVSLPVNSLAALAGQTVSYTATGLPRGLSISGTGQITGVISGWGNYAVTVTETTSSGPAESVSFTWSVRPALNPGGPIGRK
jgi:GH25 family lysozyme M1 (1,4-beta-N-acetylmuramidase)